VVVVSSKDVLVFFRDLTEENLLFGFGELFSLSQPVVDSSNGESALMEFVRFELELFGGFMHPPHHGENGNACNRNSDHLPRYGLRSGFQKKGQKTQDDEIAVRESLDQ